MGAAGGGEEVGAVSPARVAVEKAGRNTVLQAVRRAGLLPAADDRSLETCQSLARNLSDRFYGPTRGRTKNCG